MDRIILAVYTNNLPRVGQVSIHIKNVISIVYTGKNLKSYSSLDGFVPNFLLCKLVICDGAFCKAGLALWNSLPERIRQLSNLEIFKKEQKAFNFKTAFKL